MPGTPDPGNWPRLQEHSLYSAKGGAVDTGSIVKGEYGNIFGAVVEEQNKLDSYPKQMMPAKNLGEWNRWTLVR